MYKCKLKVEWTHWKRPWCWKRLKAGGEGEDRGWDGWIASPIPWTWIWANSRKQWRTRVQDVLRSMASQRVRHDLATEQQRTKALSYTTFLTEPKDTDSVSLYLCYALHFSEQDFKITNRKQEIIYVFYYLLLLLLLSNCNLQNSKYPFPPLSWEKLHTWLFNSWGVFFCCFFFGQPLL